MAPPGSTLTDKDRDLMLATWQSCDPPPKVNYTVIAEKMNYNNSATANSMWYALKKRLKLDGNDDDNVGSKKRSTDDGGAVNVEAEGEAAPPPAKKRRGRPPKVKQPVVEADGLRVEEDSASLLLADAGASLTRGDGVVDVDGDGEGAMGVVSEQTFAQMAAGALRVAEKTDRNFIFTTGDVEVSDDGNASLNAERGVGDAFEQEQAPPKKKRGRPPKAATLLARALEQQATGEGGGELAVGGQEAPPKAKRGRPPKAAKATAEPSKTRNKI